MQVEDRTGKVCRPKTVQPLCHATNWVGDEWVKTVNSFMYLTSEILDRSLSFAFAILIHSVKETDILDV